MSTAKKIELPDMYVHTGKESGLTLERNLFNSIVELCGELGLGVRPGPSNIQQCNNLFLALRDALQVINGHLLPTPPFAPPPNQPTTTRQPSHPPSTTHHPPTHQPTTYHLHLHS